MLLKIRWDFTVAFPFAVTPVEFLRPIVKNYNMERNDILRFMFQNQNAAPLCGMCLN